MLGLSVCLYAIPSCVSGVLEGVVHFGKSPQWLAIIPMVAYGIGAAIQAVVGLVIIAKSQSIARLMFKNDDE